MDGFKRPKNSRNIDGFAKNFAKKVTINKTENSNKKRGLEKNLDIKSANFEAQKIKNDFREKTGIAEKNLSQKLTKKSPKKTKKIAKTWQKTRRKWYEIEKNTAKSSRKFFLAKFGNLRFVRKQTIFWLGAILLILLGAVGQIFLMNRAILTQKNTDGGNYIEGVIDKVETINPLFAASDSEKMLSKLVFPTLLKYDEKNNLSGNLAKNWTSEDGKIWRIVLRDAIWSDGEKISADDIIFTLSEMKNPENFALQQKTFAKITTRKIDQKTLEITLPVAMNNFPHRLNFGILPAHFFQKRSVNIREFSGLKKTENISGGILRFDSKIANSRTTNLKFFANKNYFRENMKLRSFSLKIYSDAKDLERAWNSGAINAIADAPIELAEKVFDKNKNKNLRKNDDSRGEKIGAATMRDGIFAIFNNDSPKLSDKNVRTALIAATNREALRKSTVPEKMANFAPEKLETPIARGIFAEVDELEQAKFDQKKAEKLLEKSGWKIKSQEFREKNGEILTLRIVVPAGSFYEKTANNLAEQWKKIGVKTEILRPTSSKIQANYLIPRDYDVLVYQLHLGSDPDVTAYWSSSQASAQGLNLANWRNGLTDAFLSSGLRQSKKNNQATSYREFALQWIEESASMALYQANFYYISRENVRGLIQNRGELINEKSAQKITLSDLSDRANSMSDWTTQIEKTRVTP